LRTAADPALPLRASARDPAAARAAGLHRGIAIEALQTALQAHARPAATLDGKRRATGRREEAQHKESACRRH